MLRALWADLLKKEWTEASLLQSSPVYVDPAAVVTWAHVQGVASAPLWDEETGSIIGMISASDFIHILRRLRNRC